MKTISQEIINEIIIQKSKFICILKKIDNVKDVNLILEKIKEEYKGATHYCYAYIIDSYKKCSDDKEPNGTAGLPILNVIEKNDLNYILCIVVRYFGGIKLGAAGLLRAYSNSVVEALNKTQIRNIIKSKKLIITFDYDNSKIVNNLFNDNEIIKKEFDNIIKYEIIISCDKYDTIIDNLKKYTNIISEENITN